MQSFHVSTAQKAIVLNPATDAARTMLCNILPMAKPFAVSGHTLFAVPHDIDVVRLLRNVGVMAPSPILHQYKWSGAYQPFNAQRVTAEFLTLNPRAFVLNDMGTGKTNAALWAYDFKRSIGKSNRLLVTAPLSTLERTWGDTIFEHFPHLSFAILHGSKQKRFKLLDQEHDIYIVNHDGIEIIEPALAKRDDIDQLAIDELAVFRNASTARYKSLARICAPLERGVWGLTGTPIPNEPTDAWAQVRLVNPARVPKFFTRFRDMTMTKITQFKYVAKRDALDTVQEAMQPAIRFSRADCVDLPPTTYQTRHVALTPEQKKMYEQVRVDLKAEVDAGTVRAVNAADKMMKLVQVAAGAVYTTDHEIVPLDNSARIKEVLEIVEQSPGKVIVFVPFTAALHIVRDAIQKHYPTEMVYGGTSKTKRDEAFWRFRELPASESRVLVANASAMSHGLTLVSASTVVWMAPTTSHETFDQANHRIIRPGQVNNTLIVMLEGTEVERKIYATIQRRQDVQGLFLDAVHTPAD